MITIGLLYLVFEDYILADFTKPTKSAVADMRFSRTVTGLQIGLVLLSMLVTRSSALSLQAKEGLPYGNQVVGWIVMGECIHVL